MTMRIRMRAARRGEDGASVLESGRHYTVSEQFGRSLVQQEFAEIVASATPLFQDQPSLPYTAAMQGPHATLGVRRYEALYRWWGAASGGVSFNKSTSLSSLNFTNTAKLEVEAPFVSARLMWVNVGINALANSKAVIGVTETNETGTSQLMGSPVIGGTAYQALVGATDVNGWRSVTWAGAATVTVPASTTRQRVSISDEIPVKSIDRADGLSRPLLLYRAHHNGASDGAFPFLSTVADHRTPSAARRGRTLVLSANTSSDGVTSLSTTMALNTIGIEVFPIVRHTVPVLPVWSAGDSLVQNDSLVTDKISTWVERACMDASTPERPVVHANFGASSNGAAVYLDNVRVALEAGAPPPGVLVVAPGSINDITASPNPRIAEQIMANAMQSMAIAREYGIPVLVWFQILPRQDLDAAGDAIRRGINDQLQQIAAAARIPFIRWPELGDGQVPERWVPAWQGTGSHPSEAAIEMVMAPRLRDLLLELR